MGCKPHAARSTHRTHVCGELAVEIQAQGPWLLDALLESILVNFSPYAEPRSSPDVRRRCGQLSIEIVLPIRIEAEQEFSERGVPKTRRHMQHPNYQSAELA